MSKPNRRPLLSRTFRRKTVSPLPPRAREFKPKSRQHELVIQGLLFLAAVVSVLTTLAIVVFLGKESFLFFGDKEITLKEFFTSTVWQPMNNNFGILPLLNATLMTSFIAMIIAVPIGLFVAIYLSEYASGRVQAILKPVLEILAGIPTVVYGYFALTFMTPLLRNIFGQETVEIYNTASAGAVIGILILPLVSSMVEDALSAVPKSLREAAFSLGATKLETSIHIVVPAAFSGLAAAFIVGFSRAVGETMVVALASGAGPNFTFNPFKAAETITGYIVRISGGDVSYNTPDYNSIFALGLVLFFVTLMLNIVSRQIVKRYREVYE
ncbi:MAG: phosphate ABC transporter permease subunit PstC [Spirochaetota bacterium]